jgi:transposase
VHVAALLDQLGRLHGRLVIPATRAGYQQLLAWAGHHGQLTCAGVEGTGTYGARLTQFLTSAGVQVVEVDRPNRQRRRRRDKSDPTDAEAAGRAVLAGEATTTPKARSGIVESIRVLRVARAGAVKARTQTANQLRDLLVTAPEPPRAELYPLSTAKRVQRLVAQQPVGGADPAKRAAAAALQPDPGAHQGHPRHEHRPVARRPERHRTGRQKLYLEALSTGNAMGDDQE